MTASASYLGANAILGDRAASAGDAQPPGQPASGPGGKEAAHAEVVATLHGAGPRAYWLFEPAKPMPAQAPLIVFNHGWGAMDPRTYQAWIDHIVERGDVVIYPLYQDSLATPVKDFTQNAIAATEDAIRLLETEPGHVKPQLDKFAIVGHSMGGAISANMAALGKRENLPSPSAVMCVEPGKTWAKAAWAAIELADLSQIPAATLLLTVAGEDDRLARDVDAKRIFNEATSLPLANKDYVTLVSDDHGRPALKADHFAPVAWAPLPEGTAPVERKPVGPVRAWLREKIRERMRERMEARREADGDLPEFGRDDNRTLNALDFYGTWKLFDGLTDAAFYGRNRNYALGDTREQRFMGVWSDGVPVKELRVTERP
jgi:acetyl esterase/lipase